ncbi:uncharacterized protein B0I36DRAFT_368048 [Microdochium trichocladiopsis]|uniref:Uncharacterized protein n=1 Tax=Microdochium trichocladiopsis TaxID=1682393 RepID=A0A9P8XTT9_9PEZI|nr:uncharacterized protein B0I36DRAFT_368048 [Microdochium trichocladiopsis]KAH7017992.1 hypothetical protein B0I36DRAFT_368048 [Microdochium trichocladiopsis]
MRTFQYAQGYDGLQAPLTLNNYMHRHDAARRKDIIDEIDLGDNFVWRIDLDGKGAVPGQPAGTLRSSNGKDSNGDPLHFYCWPYKRKGAAQVWNGPVCDSAFVCNRNAHELFSPVLDVSISNDQTRLRHNVDVNDKIYGLLTKSLDENPRGGGNCKEIEYDIPNSDCKIQFECNAASRLQMDGLRKSLKVISQNKKFVYVEEKDDGQWSPCPVENMGRPCHQVWQPHREITTFLPAHVKMVYYANDNMQGMLEYTITCPADACGSCVNSETAQDVVGSALEEGLQGVIGGAVDVAVSCFSSALACALS